MEDRVLLINKRQNVVDEFIKAYEGESFRIDVAMSGVEGYQRLQEHAYKVVIVGMVFPDIDGEKLLAYIRKTAPETICIVYTTKLSVAQVAYLTNRMHVFKIFLRPGDYRGEILEAIEEGIENYDLKVQEGLEEEEEWKEFNLQKERYEERKKRVMDHRVADKRVFQVFDMIMKEISALNDDLEIEEREQLLKIEQEIMAQYIKENQLPVGGLMTIESKLRHQFFEGNDERKLRVHTGSTVIQLEDTFVESMYMCIWVLVYRMLLLTKQFDCYVDIDFATSSKVTLSVAFQLPAGVWQEQEKRAISRRITAVLESMIKELCAGYRREVSDIQIKYVLDLDAQNKIAFKAV